MFTNRKAVKVITVAISALLAVVMIITMFSGLIAVLV